MTIQGVDFANERPSGADLYAAGKRFVVRYLSPNTANNPGKKLTPAERDDYRGANLAICVVWETTTSRAREGYAAGAADARAAVAAAAGLGFPSGQPIYFAVDEDTSGSAVADYFHGVASVIGVARTGVYGSYRVVKYLMANGLCKYGWQTYAWSGGLWYGPAQAQQYRNGQHVPGTPTGMYLDLCRATTTDYGQWPPPQEEDMALTADDLHTLLTTLCLPATNPTETLGTAILDAQNKARDAATGVAEVGAKVDALTAAVAAIGTAGVDQDALAAKVADLLAARLKD